jgi:hypothetical protein
VTGYEKGHRQTDGSPLRNPEQVSDTEIGNSGQQWCIADADRECTRTVPKTVLPAGRDGQELIAVLAELFAAVFVVDRWKPHKPLKISIHLSSTAACCCPMNVAPCSVATVRG